MPTTRGRSQSGRRRHEERAHELEVLGAALARLEADSCASDDLGGIAERVRDFHVPQPTDRRKMPRREVKPAGKEPSRPRQEGQGSHAHTRVRQGKEEGAGRDAPQGEASAAEGRDVAGGEPAGKGAGLGLKTAEAHEWQKLMTESAARMSSAVPQLSAVLQAGEAHLLAQLRQANADKLKAQSRLEEAQMQLQQETLEKSNHALRLQSATSALTEKTAQCTRLMAQAAEIPLLEDQLARLEAHQSSKNTSLGDLEAQNSKLRARNRDMSAEMEVMRREAAAKAERARMELQESLARANNEAEAKLKGATSRLTALQAKHASTEDALAAARRALQERTDDLEKAVQEIPAMGRRVRELTSTAERLEKEKSDTLTRAADEQRRSAEQSQHAAEAEAANQRALETKVSELKVLLEESRHKASKYKAKLQGKEDALRQETERADRKNRECMKLNSEFTSFRDGTFHLEAELERLRRQTNDISHSAVASEERVREAEAQHGEAQVRLDRAEETITRHQDSLAHLKQARAESDERAAAATAKADSLEEQVMSLQAELRGTREAMEVERAKLASKIKGADGGLREAQDQVREAQQRADDADAARQAAEEACERMRAEGVRLAGQVHHLEDTVGVLRQEAAQQAAQHAAREAERVALQQEAEAEEEDMGLGHVAAPASDEASTPPTRTVPQQRPSASALSLDLTGVHTSAGRTQSRHATSSGSSVMSFSHEDTATRTEALAFDVSFNDEGGASYVSDDEDAVDAAVKAQLGLLRSKEKEYGDHAMQVTNSMHAVMRELKLNSQDISLFEGLAMQYPKVKTYRRTKEAQDDLQ